MSSGRTFVARCSRLWTLYSFFLFFSPAEKRNAESVSGRGCGRHPVAVAVAVAVLIAALVVSDEG